MKYRKKPVVIEAFRIGYDDYPEWFGLEMYSGRNIIHDVYEGAGCLIETLEGQMKANHGDYIIKGVKGELYPCKPDVFEQTYEPEEPFDASKTVIGQRLIAGFFD